MSAGSEISGQTALPGTVAPPTKPLPGREARPSQTPNETQHGEGEAGTRSLVTLDETLDTSFDTTSTTRIEPDQTGFGYPPLN